MQSGLPRERAAVADSDQWQTYIENFLKNLKKEPTKENRAFSPYAIHGHKPSSAANPLTHWQINDRKQVPIHKPHALIR
ncbi:hypothetical protein KR52_00345 [Synechococcus sp. KORDI-52]|nr:hypothetical protein KR52_00345 [Synechococcus sp. KORDI-52]